MSELIEAPKKRTYTRKPKVVALSEVLSSDSEQSTTSTVSDLSLTPPEQVAQKPKRNYKKKVAVATEPVEIPSPPVLERQSNNIREDTELIDSEPETEPVKPVKEKKPRTEKQKEAFEKMRQARLAKTEELKRLREIERDQKKLEKEEIKLENLNDKILEKAASIKQKKSRKASAKEFDDLPKEPQYVQQIPEKKHREILFV
jgi:DNA gyrase/topoisomerase IV subunit A